MKHTVPIVFSLSPLVKYKQHSQSMILPKKKPFRLPHLEILFTIFPYLMLIYFKSTKLATNISRTIQYLTTKFNSLTAPTYSDNKPKKAKHPDPQKDVRLPDPPTFNYAHVMVSEEVTKSKLFFISYWK